MSRYEPDIAFIASIYPGPLPAIRRHYGPSREAVGVGAQRSTLFKLEPVERGKKPFVMPIFDSFEDVLDVAGLSARSGGTQKPRLSKPVDVDSIVADLLKQWTGGLVGVPNGAHPGIMEIHPLAVEIRAWKDAPSKMVSVSGDELAQMQEAQTRYFEYLFSEGERLAKANQLSGITDTMRLAADWLGFERTWSHAAIARESAPCPWCQVIIPNAAIVCSSCGKQVRETPPHLLKLAGAAQPIAR